MPIIPMPEEGLHPHGPEESWQESVYLYWYDPVAQIGGTHRIGNEINRGTANIWCGVYDRSGLRFRQNLEDLKLTFPPAGHGLVGGPQSLVHDGRQLTFRLEHDDCEIELAIQDLPNDVTVLSPSNNLDGLIFSGHFNLFCRMHGSVRIGAARYIVDASGWRDHSWGPRKWNGFVGSRVLNGSFDQEITFSFLSVIGTDGKCVRKGHFCRDGKLEMLTDFDMQVLLEEDGLTLRGAELQTQLACGERLKFRADVIGGVICRTRERIGYESVCTVRLNDRAGGIANLEAVNNPRCGWEAPAFVLRNGLMNGLLQC